eukprot:TRINITY_DN71962_c0_g1_i1.p2 TRINITY_DN71962_c0_g1~~TRINITY_DN71962_c0_g1_i1.p2  ORF type:complete len:289 (+),score=46.30 TRINITY_DN71962_c0_g1_i1:113-979(+)
MAVYTQRYRAGAPYLGNHPFDPRTSTLPIAGLSSGCVASGMNYNYLPRGTPIVLPVADPQALAADARMRGAGGGYAGSGSGCGAAALSGAAGACAGGFGGPRGGAAAGAGAGYGGCGSGLGANGPAGACGGGCSGFGGFGQRGSAGGENFPTGTPVRIVNMTHERTEKYNGLVGDIVHHDIPEDGDGDVLYVIRCPIWNATEWSETKDVNDPYRHVAVSRLAARGAEVNRQKLYPGAPPGQVYVSEYSALAVQSTAATLERAPPYVVLRLGPERFEPLQGGGQPTFAA